MAERSFDEMVETGVLWAINRTLFHPRGYALTFHYDAVNDLTGWSVQGDGTEAWSFTEETDDEKFAEFESFLQEVCGG